MGATQAVSAAVLAACCVLGLVGCTENGDVAREPGSRSDTARDDARNDVELDTANAGDSEDDVAAADVKLFPLKATGSSEDSSSSLWGYIDRTGAGGCPAAVLEAQEFHEGRAFVKYAEGRYGIIDESGAFVASTTFGWAFREGRALVLLAGEVGGRSIAEWGYIDRQGQLVIPGPFVRAEEFHESLAAVEPRNAEDGSDGQSGFIDTTGKMVIPARFRSVGSFSEGLAAAAVDDLSKMGYIDRSGRFVLAPGMGTGAGFSEGLAACRRDETDELRVGYIDKTGTFVIAPQFANAGKFSGGRAVVKLTEQKFKDETPDWGVIDTSALSPS